MDKPTTQTVVALLGGLSASAHGISDDVVHVRWG